MTKKLSIINAYINFVIIQVSNSRVRSGAKVLPCGIKGGVKGNRKVTIKYGKPLDYSEYKGKKDKETLEKITKEIMDNIIEL